MRLQPLLLALPLLLAGCACSGSSHSYDADTTYAVIDSSGAGSGETAVVYDSSTSYGSSYGSASGGASATSDSYYGSGSGWGTAAGGLAAYDASNPCAPCAPTNRTVYHDGGTAYVDHVHQYREVHRHSMAVTREDAGCTDCPPGVNPGVMSR